jgi:peptidoglycan hydrolase-like protein with peptidoglycan-binding domain
VLGHKEVAYPRGRKVDPSFDMVMFRAVVLRYMGLLSDVSRDKPRPPRFELARLLHLADPAQRGKDVLAVQKALVAQRISLPRSRQSDGSYDGVFGKEVDSAVRRFQRSKNLVADGVVGPRTAKALGGTWTGKT